MSWTFFAKWNNGVNPACESIYILRSIYLFSLYSKHQKLCCTTHARSLFHKSFIGVWTQQKVITKEWTCALFLSIQQIDGKKLIPAHTLFLSFERRRCACGVTALCTHTFAWDDGERHTRERIRARLRVKAAQTAHFCTHTRTFAACSLWEIAINLLAWW